MLTESSQRPRIILSIQRRGSKAQPAVAGHHLSLSGQLSPCSLFAFTLTEFRSIKLHLHFHFFIILHSMSAPDSVNIPVQFFVDLNISIPLPVDWRVWPVERRRWVCYGVGGRGGGGGEGLKEGAYLGRILIISCMYNVHKWQILPQPGSTNRHNHNTTHTAGRDLT